jgi:5-methylcytosine-specific restriction endonuclease McrA
MSRRLKPRQCTYCDALFTDEPKTRDHIYPRARFAVRPAELNITPACKRCNRDKGANTVPEWIAILRYHDDPRARTVSNWWAWWHMYTTPRIEILYREMAA